MIGQRHEIARFQSDYFRLSYHKILRHLIIAVSIILLLIALIIYKIIFQAPAKYYASTTTGQIVPLQPLKG